MYIIVYIYILFLLHIIYICIYCLYIFIIHRYSIYICLHYIYIKAKLRQRLRTRSTAHLWTFHCFRCCQALTLLLMHIDAIPTQHGQRIPRSNLVSVSSFSKSWRGGAYCLRHYHSVEKFWQASIETKAWQQTNADKRWQTLTNADKRPALAIFLQSWAPPQIPIPLKSALIFGSPCFLSIQDRLSNPQIDFLGLAPENSRISLLCRFGIVPSGRTGPQVQKLRSGNPNDSFYMALSKLEDALS